MPELNVNILPHSSVICNVIFKRRVYECILTASIVQCSTSVVYSKLNLLPALPISSGTNSRPPTGPPPPFTPSKVQAIHETFGGGSGAFMVIDSSVIQTLMFRYVYIWLKDGKEFWAWINFVDSTSAGGFQWNGSNWIPFRIDIKTIDGIAGF